MIMGLYSVKDKLLGFAPPVTVENDKAAIRWFESVMANKKDSDKVDTKYWDLYKVGSFDTDTGEIKGNNTHDIELLREGETLNE